MTIENTVSSDFCSTFVDCKERFRLPPIRYGGGQFLIFDTVFTEVGGGPFHCS